MSEEEVQWVKLISAEGHEFFVDRSIAIAYSKTISLMLEGSFREAQDNIIRFPDMAGYILERVVKYLHYKARYSNSTSRIPEFVSNQSACLRIDFDSTRRSTECIPFVVSEWLKSQKFLCQLLF